MAPAPARFLSTANRVVAALSGGSNTTAALATNSRGYLSVASRSAVAVAEEKQAASRNKVSAESAASSSSSSWVPDPVTGYYRPANHADEVDPAELRAMLLSRNKLHH